MKRTLSLIVALAIAVSCFAVAFADSTEKQSGTPGDGNVTQPQQPEGSSPDQALQVLVEKGIISQETLDAILKYMEENRPELPENNGSRQQPGDAPAMPSQNGSQKPDGTPPQMPNGNAPAMPNQDSNPPQKPESDQNGNPPAMPDGEAPADGEAPQMMLSQELLDDLLEAGVITQEEYDAIVAYQQTYEADQTQA